MIDGPHVRARPPLLRPINVGAVSNRRPLAALAARIFVAAYFFRRLRGLLPLTRTRNLQALGRAYRVRIFQRTTDRMLHFPLHRCTSFGIRMPKWSLRPSP